MFSPRAIHIIDPGLFNVAGHNLTQDLSIARECQKREIPVTIYCRLGAHLGISDVRIVEVFRADIFAEPRAQRQEFAPFEIYFLINRIFMQDLNLLPSADFSANDLIYFPNLTQNQIEAVADWLISLPIENRPIVAITLRYLSWQMQYNRARGYGTAIELLYSHVLPKLLERHPRTHLFSDTQVLSENFSRVSGTQVVTLPIPQAGYAPKKLRANNEEQGSTDRNLSLLYIGGWGDVHGSCFLPEIIASVLNEFPNVSFTVQVNVDPAAKAADVQIMAVLSTAFAPRVRLLIGKLSSEAYATEMENADVVLLLYQPANYWFASSGVFTEAAARGKVMVVTAGTTLETSVRAYALGAVIAPEFSVDSCSLAVKKAIAEFAEFDQQATDTYTRFAQENSPQGFIDRFFAQIERSALEKH
jgi:hypothetical protein